MDIYHRLKEDHEKQRGFIKILLETEGESDERSRLFKALKVELEAHADAEEQVFYAALLAKPDGQEKARHSVVEHHDMNDLVTELEETDMGEGAWLRKFKQLAHDVIHHLDEEEKEVFPLARKLIDDGKAEPMVAEFDRRKAAEAKEAAD